MELFDALDGLRDGIIDDPTSIRFDPEVLACGTGAVDSSLCLSPDQVLSVRAAYRPLIDTQGREVYPSFEVGVNTGVFSNNQANGVPLLEYRVLEVSGEPCPFVSPSVAC
jgi:hypothetical protein